MGTKAQPGKWDCYSKAKPDEPMFILLARDPLAPILVRLWADLQQGRRVSATEKENEALACAQEMQFWYDSNIES